MRTWSRVIRPRRTASAGPLDGGYRQAGALDEQRHLEACDQSQRVHHEFETPVPGRNRMLFLYGRAGGGLLQVFARLLVAHLAQDAIGERKLGMRAGAYAEVVAEAPVIEVVPALAARSGEGRGLVVEVAGVSEPLIDHVLHVGGEFRVRQRRRMAVKEGVGFQREVVGRKVGGAEAQRRIDVLLSLLQRLLRQGVHQVEVDIVEMRLRNADRAARLFATVNAAQRLQLRGIEALDADREAVDAASAVIAKLGRFERAWIGFQRDFRIGGEIEPGAERRQQFLDRARGEQARRAAAEKYRIHAPAPDLRQGKFQVGDQRAHVVLLRRLAPDLVRIEVAVRALFYAPGNMHIERQRRQRLQACAARRRSDAYALGGH